MKKRKLIDERGRIFGVVSAVDIFAVLLLIAVLIMAYMRFFSGGEANVSESGFVPVRYEIKISRVRSATVNAIRVNDRLLSEDGEDLGVVTDIATSPAIDQVSCTDGTVRTMEVEGYVDAVLSVLAQGTVSGDRYFAGRTYELGVNGVVRFTSKYVSTSGRIWSIG